MVTVVLSFLSDPKNDQPNIFIVDCFFTYSVSMVQSVKNALSQTMVQVWEDVFVAFRLPVV